MKRSATLSLITVISAAYLVNLVYPAFYDYTALFRPFVDSGEYWRLFTVALVHGGLTHLFFNMFSLLVLGNPVEAALGKARFLVIFLISLDPAQNAFLPKHPPNFVHRRFDYSAVFDDD